MDRPKDIKLPPRAIACIPDKRDETLEALQEQIDLKNDQLSALLDLMEQSLEPAIALIPTKRKTPIIESYNAFKSLVKKDNTDDNA